jgi:hypothetical protein
MTGLLMHCLRTSSVTVTQGKGVWSFLCCGRLKDYVSSASSYVTTLGVPHRIPRSWFLTGRYLPVREL